MKKKIILYVGGFELPDKNAAAQRCISNAKIFRDLGYEVILLGIHKMDKSPLIKSEYYGFTCWSIPYPNSAKAWLKKIISFNQVDYLLEHEYRNQVFAVICYNHPAISQYRIKKVAKKNGALTLADVTEWYSASGNKFFHKIIKWLDTSLRMRVVNFLMDGLITTSNYLTHFYKGKKILVELPTLYDKQRIDLPEWDSRKNLSGCYILLYAGSPFDVRQAVKNRSSVKERLDLIIHSLFNLSAEGVNFRLNIFGVTKEDYLMVYPDDSDKLDTLKKQVSFKGRCAHETILENIMESDFSIFFRDITRVTLAGFPSKFAESITYGTPVITNEISNITPYAEVGKNCFFIDIDDPEKRDKQLKSILTLSQDAVGAANNHCLESEVFDYRLFKQDVKQFIARVSEKHEN